MIYHAISKMTYREIATATVGCLGVALIGFDASPFGPAPFYIGLSLLLAGLPLLPVGEFRERIKDPIVLIVLLLAVWSLIRGAADLVFPTMNMDLFNSENWWSFFRISGIFSLLIGFWVSCYPKAGLLGIASMIIGMASNAIVYKFWKELALAFSSGYRFEGEAAIGSMGAFTAPMPAIGLLLAVLGGGWLFTKRHRILVSLFIVICTYYTVTNLLILLATKSRHNWIASIVAIGIALVLIIRHLYSTKNLNIKNLSWIIIPILLICTITISWNWNLITNRWSQEAQTIKALATLNFEQIEMNSLGKRYAMVDFGIDNIAKHPFAGWGPGFAKATFNLTHIQEIKKFNGYHNLYIQLAVTMGVIWTFLWVFYHCIMIKRSYKSLHDTNTLIGLIIIITVLVSGLAEFRFWGINGTDLYVFGAGVMMGGVLHKNTDIEEGNRS
jgi:O-antigen ligase